MAHRGYRGYMVVRYNRNKGEVKWKVLYADRTCHKFNPKGVSQSSGSSYRMLVVYVGSLFTETAIFDGAADTCSG